MERKLDRFNISTNSAITARNSNISAKERRALENYHLLSKDQVNDYLKGNSTKEVDQNNGSKNHKENKHQEMKSNIFNDSVKF